MESPARFTSSLFSLHKSLRLFSSASTPACDGFPSFFADHSGGAIEESPIYRRSMIRRPATVKPWNLGRNSCSFIGTVIRPVKRFAGKNYSLGVYTFLEVKRPSRDWDCSSFQILLALWDELSEISLRHLKPNDYIYVHGPLCSYEKVNASGKREIFYKVFVRDLNFVKRNPSQTRHKSESSGAEESTMTTSAFDQERVPSSGVSGNEAEYRDRLRLWQVFFANPYEWWDNRQGKRNPRSPDFKHKDTKECLWLSPDDPPWVRKQLQLYDSRMAGGRSGRSDAFEWKLKDFE